MKMMLSGNLKRLQPIAITLQRFMSTLPRNDLEQKELTATVKRIRQELEQDKQELKWRTPIGDRPEDWNSKLKLFSNTEQTSDFIVMMQRPLDVTPKAMKQWWSKRQERTERFMQQYIPERHKILGPELAAAHFILYRGGAVKFFNDATWQRATEDGEINLPNMFHPDYKVEALRCDNMNLFYEGLENIRGLQQLKFLSFHNVKQFDDWCLDRVTGSDFPRLEVLDISGTDITANGLSSLYRLSQLKLLILQDPKQNLEMELAVSILESEMPRLKIVGANVIHSE